MEDVKSCINCGRELLKQKGVWLCPGCNSPDVDASQIFIDDHEDNEHIFIECPGATLYEEGTHNVIAGVKFHDNEDPSAERGWQRIVATGAGDHPYAASWWPEGHIIGYEHTFTNQLADMVRVLGGEDPVMPIADFADAYETQRVLEAALISARERCAVKLSQVK